MRRKTLTIPAGPRARQLLAQAIGTFAEAAYPPGASECAQVARESLLGTAATIARAVDAATVSARQRSLLKQAVTWYFAEVSPQTPAPQVQALLELLRGQPADDDLFT